MGSARAPRVVFGAPAENFGAPTAHQTVSRSAHCKRIDADALEPAAARRNAMMPRVHFVSSMLVVACAAGSVLCAAPPSAEQADFFEKQIRPVLVERCYECHSAGKKTKGGL